MSEAKFTKGPWKFNAHDGSITDCTKAENEIATAQLDDWHYLGIGYANAHLIAAAPELYKMVEILIGNYQEVASVLEHEGYKTSYLEDAKAVDALLAKARGEV